MYGEKTVNTKYYQQNDIKIKAISGGSNHGLTLSSKGIVYSFGDKCGKGDTKGSFGDSGNFVSTPCKVDIDNNIVNIVCGGDHSLILSKNNQLFVFGYNTYRQCSVILPASNILYPKKFDKIKELGKNYFIDEIYALYNDTIFVCSPFTFK